MSNEERGRSHPEVPGFRIDRRRILQSLATGAGVAAFAPGAAAATGHAHHAAVAAPSSAPAAASGASPLVFFDAHAFDTLSALSEQIVPGARAAGVPEFLDRLLAVESTATQQRAMQTIGVFER